MHFEQAVLDHQARLTESDRRLVALVLEDPATAAFESAEELAQRAGVHAATVVRFAKKLGFDGFPALRASLAAELRESLSPASRVLHRLHQSDPDDLLTNVVAEEVKRLQVLATRLTQEQLDEAARLVVEARQVRIFAHGHATALAELLERRLRRGGVDARLLTGSPRDLAEQLVGLASDELVIAFALRAVPPSLAAVLGHAASVGAASIVVTDTLGPLLAPQPDLVLAAPRGDQQDFLSLVVPLVICEALVLTIAQNDRGRTIDSLERLGQLMDRLAGHPPDRPTPTTTKGES